ncbi:hypothetical protein DPMN_041602 [Dreissena polymorpha]|uniref:C1q domain-containing protein n=1 Tax=Dreissena polymorpha TaxID=45954 RepID=A0A9D4CZM3_DREPO|nr:hypothetical protein DPMN_041602 [Dreissena polymorpha]
MFSAELATPVVAFHANTPDQTLSLNQIIDMQHVTLNEGGAYDSIHGIFTAPYSGVYFFATQICYSSANTFSYKIMVEENEVGHISQYNYNGFINCGSAHVVTAVKEKQRVWIKSYQTGQFNLNNNGTSFMGFLLQKTKGNVV